MMREGATFLVVNTSSTSFHLHPSPNVLHLPPLNFTVAVKRQLGPCVIINSITQELP